MKFLADDYQSEMGAVIEGLKGLGYTMIVGGIGLNFFVNKDRLDFGMAYAALCVAVALLMAYNAFLAFRSYIQRSRNTASATFSTILMVPAGLLGGGLFGVMAVAVIRGAIYG